MDHENPRFHLHQASRETLFERQPPKTKLQAEILQEEAGTAESMSTSHISFSLASRCQFEDAQQIWLSFSAYTHLVQALPLWCGTCANAVLSILNGILSPLGEMVLPRKNHTYTRIHNFPVLKGKREEGREF